MKGLAILLGAGLLQAVSAASAAWKAIESSDILKGYPKEFQDTPPVSTYVLPSFASLAHEV
jgi:hypothetical protein